MTMAVVQHNLAIHSSGVPGSVTIGSTPTVGNLIIAFVGCNITYSSITIGSGWTLFDAAIDGQSSNCTMTAMYRYVQAGDTTALPAFWSAGGTYWTHDVYEISGVSGTWNTDFLSSVPRYASTAVTSPIQQFPIFASGIALTSVARYNGSANWTISGSWTLDDAANNNGNFGSAAGASRVVSNADTIDGTWSGGGTSTPLGSMLVILTTTQPSGGVYPRHVYHYSSNGAPGAITVPWTPKVGSLLLCYLNWANGSGNPTIGSGWTDWIDTTLSNKMQLGLYRYVQPGDTSTLPVVVSSGSSFYALTFIELDGGTGTFSNDHVHDEAAVQINGSSMTTTADTTTANNQFALLAYANYDGTAIVTTTGFTNYLDTDTTGSYGSWFVAFEFFPTSGTTVQGTIVPSDTTHPQGYVQSIFNQETGVVIFNDSDSESMGLASTQSAAAIFASAVTEHMSLADTVSAEDQNAAFESEAMGLSDSISVSAIFVAAVTEHMGLLDSVIGDLGDDATESESMGLTDTVDAVFIPGGAPGMIIFVAG